MSENLEDLIEKKVLEWNSKLGLKATLVKGEWTMRCPFHEDSDPSFGINSENGHWHCFGCGVGGKNFYYLVRKMAEKYGWEVEAEYVEARGSIKVSPYRLGGEEPKKAKVKWFSVDDLGIAYFKSRGFTEFQARAVIKDFEIRQAFYSHVRYLVFPIADWDGTYLGYVRRSIEGEKDYRASTGFDAERYFYGEWMLDFNAPKVHLVEGPFDYLKVRLAGYQVLAALNFKKASLKLARLRERFKGEIVNFWDADVTPDTKKWKEWVSYEQMFGIPHSSVSPTEAQDDPGKMSLGEIRGLLG